jgi:hypothetical protein
MAAATYITTADVDAQIGTAERQALFTDDAAGSSYDSTEFDRVVELASAACRVAGKHAGYTLGTSSTDDSVKLVTLGAFLTMAYGRKGQSVPVALTWLTNLLEGLRLGEYPLTETDPDPDHARGGNQFTESTSGVTGSSPSIYNDEDNPLRGCY